MKVIFLDIDGVLIWIWNAMRKSRSEKIKDWIINNFDEALVNNFKKLLKETWAKIVISSSWRHNMKRCRNAFIEAWLDWNLVISKTPDWLWYWRWNEVLEWLNNYHKNCKDWYHIKKWIMIDDDDFDAKCVKRLWRFIHTPKIALTLKKVEQAINLLND